jgi:hypothetical protein
MPSSRKRSLIVGFDSLDEHQFGVVLEMIEAVGQHTCKSSYFDVTDVTDTDIALLYGLAALTGRLKERDLTLDPQSRHAKAAWQAARKKYQKLERMAADN